MPYAQATREAFQKNLDDPRHGTENGYTNLKCRCERCVEEGRAMSRAYAYIKKRNRNLFPIPIEVHGTYNGYCNFGCRCELCFEAKRIVRLQARLRKKRERLLALNEAAHRLADAEILNDPEFQESLEQMRRGEGVVLYPKKEES